MATYTPNLNLKKPSGNEYYDVVAEDNDAKDKIDFGYGQKASKVDLDNLKSEFKEKSNNVLLKMMDEPERSIAIQVLSDSTANDVADWPYQLAEKLKVEHQNHNIKYLLFDDANKEYLPEQVIQTGLNGDRYLNCDTGILCPKFATTKHVAGKIDVRAKFSMSDWTPASSKAVAGRTGVEGQRGWHCGVSEIIGRPYFTIYPDGTAASAIVMYCYTPPGFTDGDIFWLRWVFTPNDGAGNRTLTVYKSNNGYAWTLLEAPNVIAGAVSFFDNSANVALECGGAAGLSTGMKLYNIQIRDGVTGDSIAPFLPDLWEQADDLNRTAQMVGSPVLTIVNGSIPGASIDYLMVADRKHSMTPDYGQIMTLISSSHNEGGIGNLGWAKRLDSIVDFIKGKYSLNNIYLLTQNPEIESAPGHVSHRLRRLDTLRYAKVKKYEVIDVFKVFDDYTNWRTLLMADSVHPNATGGLLWADTVYNHIKL